jgi:N-acetylglucosaminyldiphosphoundecaprenol N-acetyl-beta-D-mannosaminyltransferase
MKKLRDLLVVSGVPIDRLTMEQAVEFIDQFVIEGRLVGRCHQVITVNADFIVKSIFDQDLLRILQDAQLSTPDGISLIWSSRLLGVPIEHRVCGSDLVPRLASLASEKGYSLYLLGAGPGVALRAAQLLQKEYPNLKIVGVSAPPTVQLHQQDLPLVEEINATRPDILLVAFGNPKQEKWISMHQPILRTSVAIGVGGTFNFIAGEVKRAPQWFQNAGLEWLYRTWQEPSRFGERIVLDSLFFFPQLFRQIWTTNERLKCQKSFSSNFKIEILDQVVVLRLLGNITVRDQPALKENIESILTEHPYLIVDLSKVKFIDSVALGLLVAMAKFCREADGDLWLAGATSDIKQTLSCSRLQRFFAIYNTVEQALDAR